MTGSNGGTTAEALPVSDDRLLLDELNHRTANEVAAALAALRLIKSASGSQSRWRMVNEAIDRFEGFAEVHRLLSGRILPQANVALIVERLCLAMMTSHYADGRCTVRLCLEDVWTDGETARRLALIAHELVANAVRHAFGSGDGNLHVVISGQTGPAGYVMLSVGDDGPGLAASAATSGSGLGGTIVAELVRRGGGSIDFDTGEQGTTVFVRLPVDRRINSWDQNGE